MFRGGQKSNKKGAYKEAPSISQSKQSVELNSDRH